MQQRLKPNAAGTMATAKQLWAFSISSDEKEAVTGVRFDVQLVAGKFGRLKASCVLAGANAAKCTDGRRTHVSSSSLHRGARALPSMLFETGVLV